MGRNLPTLPMREVLHEPEARAHSCVQPPEPAGGIDSSAGKGTLLAPSLPTCTPGVRPEPGLEDEERHTRLRFLALLTLLVTAADHWTTYLCLHGPVPGWTVSEANPISDWLFQSVGLVPGLVLDSGITVLAVLFLATTPLIPQRAKGFIFTFAVAWTGYAVVNNLQALAAMGLSPLGPI